MRVRGVENTLHVRAELKKHQREAAIKATQMDAHVQYAVLAEIPAARPSTDPPPPPVSCSYCTSSISATTPHSGVARQPPRRRNRGRRAKRQHRALALAAARTATTSKAAPATRGAPDHGRSGAPIEAAALAAALAESALESESEDKAGPWGQFTPSHLYDFDGLYDPD
jgi:hypothetical protein